uniref:Uncharacterized protein n=1 Tax=Aureoumbra lagunensis TaxID=44058 RepID=A0A7S3JY61_9STRA
MEKSALPFLFAFSSSIPLSLSFTFGPISRSFLFLLCVNSSTFYLSLYTLCTLRFVEVQDIFESAVLAKEILIRESIRPRIGALCNAQLSDDLYEGSILNISGDNVLFSYDNKSIDVPLSDIDAFVLQPLDIRNTTLENFCSIQFVTSYEDFWLPRIALRRLPVKRQSIDSPNFRTPFSINLTFHELQLEISRFDSCIAQSLSTASQPSRSL